MQHLLDQCRENFGFPERSFSFWTRFSYLYTERGWCRKTDRLSIFFDQRDDLLKHGEVVWGHIVQANERLFEGGAGDQPGEIVFPSIASVQIDPAELAEVASRLFDLRETGPFSGQLAEIVDHLNDEYHRVFGMPVPDELSPQFQSMMSTSMIARRHLPRRRLCCPLLPIIASPREPRIVMPLPSRYWPKELVHWWTHQ